MFQRNVLITDLKKIISQNNNNHKNLNILSLLLQKIPKALLIE